MLSPQGMTKPDNNYLEKKRNHYAEAIMSQVKEIDIEEKKLNITQDLLDEKETITEASLDYIFILISNESF